MKLEMAKLELSRKRIRLGIDEYEYKILELQDHIKRIEMNMDISLNKLKALNVEIEKLSQEK